MTPETKLAMRRWTIRTLRKLVDFIDGRLHAAEVRLRDDIAVSSMRGGKGAASGLNVAAVPAKTDLSARTAPVAFPKSANAGNVPVRAESFSQWEARRSGVAPISKKTRRRGMSAREFDLRFAR